MTDPVMVIGIGIIIAIMVALIAFKVWEAIEEDRMLETWTPEERSEYWRLKMRRHMTVEERQADDIRAIREEMEQKKWEK